MKKYVVLILSICFLIVSFVRSWYSDQLLDALFIFALIPTLILMIAFNILFVMSIIGIYKDKSYINIISIIFLISSIILFVFFPFRDAKVHYELDKYEKPRLEIIDMIQTNKLKAKDENGNVTLPKKYKKYSTSGEVSLYQNDKDGQVIGFWVFRGMQSGSIELMYSTGGEKLIKANETGHPIIKIEKLKDKWYLVTTDY